MRAIKLYIPNWRGKSAVDYASRLVNLSADSLAPIDVRDHYLKPMHR